MRDLLLLASRQADLPAFMPIRSVQSRKSSARLCWSSNELAPAPLQVVSEHRESTARVALATILSDGNDRSGLQQTLRPQHLPQFHRQKRLTSDPQRSLESPP